MELLRVPLSDSAGPLTVLSAKTMPDGSVEVYVEPR